MSLTGRTRTGTLTQAHTTLWNIMLSLDIRVKVSTGTGGCQFTNSAALLLWEPQIPICVGVWRRTSHISILQIQCCQNNWRGMQRGNGSTNFMGEWRRKGIFFHFIRERETESLIITRWYMIWLVLLLLVEPTYSNDQIVKRKEEKSPRFSGFHVSFEQEPYYRQNSKPHYVEPKV